MTATRRTIRKKRVRICKFCKQRPGRKKTIDRGTFCKRSIVVCPNCDFLV